MKRNDIESLGFDRALIVQKHWCGLILDNVKTWEMRSARTTHRGLFGLIESGSGLIIGKANLCDCLGAIPKEKYSEYSHMHRIYSDIDRAANWKFPWVIDNAVRFDEPVPYRHPRGAVIWVKLTDEMLA